MKSNVVEFFKTNTYSCIKDTGMTWDEVGSKFNISGEAARSQWRNYKPDDVVENSRFISKSIQKCKQTETEGLPKILVFDLETAPLRAYVWRLWKQNVNPTNGQLQSEWFLLTYAAKWLFDDKVICGKLTPEEVSKEDDSRLLRDMWDLLNEADIIIAHNGMNFDVPIINGRFIKHGMLPPMPYKVIDTLRHVQKQFNLPSNKLDYIGQYLGLGCKIKTDFDLWVRCLQGDNAALSEMEIYNIQDVKLLEDVYLTIRPYIQPHPNLGLYIASDVQCCPSCMSKNLVWQGHFTTYANTYKAFRCNDCGSIGRSREGLHKRKNLLKPIPVQ